MRIMKGKDQTTGQYSIMVNGIFNNNIMALNMILYFVYDAYNDLVLLTGWIIWMQMIISSVV